MPVTDLSPVRGEDVPPDFSSGADVLDSPAAPAVPTLFRRSVKRATAPVLAAVFVLSVWQLAALSGLFPGCRHPSRSWTNWPSCYGTASCCRLSGRVWAGP